MPSLTAFSDLVERIYDAAWMPNVWSQIPHRVAELHDSPYAMLFAVRLPGVEEGFHFIHGVPDFALEAWQAGASQDDVWVRGAIEKGLFISGHVARGEELVSDEVFLASEFYKRFLMPQDCRYLMSGVLFDGTAASLPVSLCSVMRGHKSSRFADEDVRLHRLITNHLSKSMATMWRLRSREMEVASTYSALDRLPSAILLMSPGGTVSFGNRAALALLAQGEGVSLRTGTAGDRMTFEHADSQRRFDAMVKDAVSSDRDRKVDHFSAGLKVPRPSGAMDYVVQVAPLGAQSGFAAHGEEHRAIVFISDPSERGRLDAKMLSTLYNLTAAEIRLAEALMAGDTLAEVAAQLGIKENTAKTQLRGVFQKTRTTRQGQLIKLLMSVKTAL